MIPRPDFIPPNTPAPLLTLGTVNGIKRSIPIIAFAVFKGTLDYADAHDLIVRAYIQNCSLDDSTERLLRISDRLGELLCDAVAGHEEIHLDYEQAIADAEWNASFLDAAEEHEAMRHVLPI